MGEPEPARAPSAASRPVPPIPPRRVSWLGRALDPYRHVHHQGVVVPPLPPGRVVLLPGRGETFARVTGPEDATPVLLLHGWMASADLNWFRAYGPLGASHRLIAPDLRGHGRGVRGPSPFSLEDCADDAAALLRELGIARAVALGYSMGGPVAMLLWRRHPELVAGLVLEATGLRWSITARERWFWRAMGIVSVLLRWPTGRIVLLRLMGGVERLPTDLLTYRAWAEGEFRRSDPMEMAEAGRALGRFDASGFARAIDVPVAVVVTRHDRMVPTERQFDLARACRATTFELAGDHNAVAMDPQAFADVTLRAIAAVSEGRPGPAPA